MRRMGRWMQYRGLDELRREESGNSSVEFAVSVSVLLMVIFGIMDMSRALYADHFVSNAAREATRYCMVRGSSWKNAPCSTPSTYSCTATSTDVTNFVKSTAPSGFASGLTVNTTWPGTTGSGATCSPLGINNAPNCEVTVQVVYAFNFVLPFLPKNALTLSSTSSMAIAQ